MRGEHSPLLAWNPGTLEAMASVVAAAEKQEKSAKVEILKELLALRKRALGREHMDTNETSTLLIDLGKESKSDLGREESLPETEGGPGPVMLGISPGLHSEGGAVAVEAKTTHLMIIDGLWRDVELKNLKELHLQDVQGLDSELCRHIVEKALSASCLHSLELR
jgi:hypothetical protein